MDEATKHGEFSGWAVVELFGHQREVGFVTTEVFGAAVLFRIDTPELPKREYRLARPEWTQIEGGDVHLAPAGSLVQRDGSPARSKLVGPSAIYAITPCTEAAATKAIEGLIRRELILLELPDKKPIIAGQLPGETDDYTDDGMELEDDYEEEETRG